MRRGSAAEAALEGPVAGATRRRAVPHRAVQVAELAARVDAPVAVAVEASQVGAQVSPGDEDVAAGVAVHGVQEALGAPDPPVAIHAVRLLLDVDDAVEARVVARD